MAVYAILLTTTIPGFLTLSALTAWGIALGAS